MEYVKINDRIRMFTQHIGAFVKRCPTPWLIWCEDRAARIAVWSI